MTKDKGRDLTQSYDKSPYTDRKIQKSTWKHKNATKNSITQRLRTDLGQSVVVTIDTQLVWLNRLTGSQSSHSPQQLCNPMHEHAGIILVSWNFNMLSHQRKWYWKEIYIGINCVTRKKDKPIVLNFQKKKSNSRLKNMNAVNMTVNHRVTSQKMTSLYHKSN